MNYKVTFPVILVIFLMSCGDTTTSPPETERNELSSSEIIYNNVLTYQINYIRSLQLTSGAIKDNESSNSRICPYFANYACMALLKYPAENISMVKKYMQWYMGKLNGTVNPVTGGIEIPGSIYDYYGTTETTNGTYDSVDSYAATFLILAKELAAISPENKEWLQQYAEELTLVSKAMEKCIDTDYNTVPNTFSLDDNDGLSIASYVYAAKYLMDNCEVNLGLKAAKWLKENGLISDESGDFAVLLNKNTSSIESELWRGTVYNWIDNGTPTAITNWNIFYADATSQLYPGLFGIIDPFSERANRLYTKFNQTYPNWSSGQVYSGTYPWTLVVYAAANINDSKKVEEYMKHINSYNTKNTQKAYWYNLEAAFVILAINKIKNIGDAPLYVAIN